MRKLSVGLLLSSCLVVVGCIQVNATAALIRTDDVAAGTDCAAGGKKLSFGVDADGSGKLDDAEVSSTTFVCNGEAGAAGAQGQAGEAGTAGAAGKGVVTATAQATAEDCAAGGSVFMAGVDDDGDGTLDLPGEVDSTVKVCNGSAGTNGSNGANGSDGATPVVSTFAAGEEGTNCATTGGVKVVVGTQAPVYVCNGAAGSTGNTGANGNDGATPVVSTFAAGEEGTNCATTGGVKVAMGTADPVYVCNGEAGAPGNTGANGNDGATPVVTSFAPGEEGPNCEFTGGVKVAVGASDPVYVCNGGAGAQGTSGFNSLVVTSVEPRGLSCPASGVRIDVGLDNGDNGGIPADGTLQAGEIDQTQFVCRDYTPVLRSASVPATTVHALDLGLGTPWPGELPMMAAWDGTHYWFTTGTDRQGGRLIKVDSNLTQVVADYSAPGDDGNFRSVITQYDGMGPVMVTRAFDSYISTFSEGNGTLTLTGVSQLLNAAGNDAYSRDPVLTWDEVNGEWISRTVDTYYRFDANFAYLGSFQGRAINASWPLSLVAYKGRLISYEDASSPRRLVVYSRDGALLEQLELADGPGLSLGLSLANGKLWLSDLDTTPRSFKAYDVLQ